jgi:CDP-diacylglycerol--glycerol-3-phosphate 3-phosphatidyltransferase
VRVAGIGKIKTIAQLVALVVLLYQKDLDGFGLFHVGEVLLGLAAALTIWSGVVYVRAAWPVLRAER